MSSEKVFVVVEAVDKPAGAMLVRYQAVERVEPDPEEDRLAKVEVERRLKDIPEGMREDFRAQVAAAQHMMGMGQKSSYRIEEKVLICHNSSEVAEAVGEAKAQYEEIKKLKKSGAHFELSTSSLRF